MFAHSSDGLGGVELGHRGLERVRPALVLEEARAPHEHARGVRLQHHVGDHRLDQLEARDRPAELLALLGVLDRLLHAALADAHAAGGDRVAPRVERRHRDFEAVADAAEHLLVGDLDVFERDRGRVGGVQTHLVLDRLRFVAGLVGVHEEAREALVAERRGRSGRRSAPPWRSCPSRSTSWRR